MNDPNCHDLVWKLRRSLARSKVPEKEILSSLEYYDSNGSGYVSMKQFSKVRTYVRTCVKSWNFGYFFSFFFPLNAVDITLMLSNALFKK